MYRNYSQHSELNRLVGAAAVSRQFRQTLLQNPRQVLDHGCLGYQFNLTAEEAELVAGAAALGDIRPFALQVWEWMGHHGRGEASPRTASPFEDAFVGTRPSTAPVEEEREKPQHRLFASQLSSISLNRRAGMEPLILVVDDNRDMARGLQFTFEIEGYRVALASDVESAVNFLEYELPDLILSDVRLPGTDGHAFLRAVKQNPKWRDVPFVFLTAVADWEVAVKSKSLGADEFVVKPFRLGNLMGIVKQFTGVADEAGVGSEQSGRRANGR